MLTDLDFLKRGGRWPPEAEERRLETYRANRKLFEDDHAEVYIEQMRRIERLIGKSRRAVSFATVLNYQRLISIKIADLVFGEPPKITAATEKQQEVIDRVLSKTNLLAEAYICAIDVSRYGDGLLLLGNNQGIPGVTAVGPCHWFPVVSADNIKRTLYHVFGWTYPVDPKHTRWELKAEIHSPQNPGECEQHRYQLDGGERAWRIGQEITGQTETMLETSLSVCPVFRVSNTLTSDRVFGIDDYQSIDSIISELMVRISQISRVLDKHANPSMTGPESALEKDEATDEWRIRVGDYFPRRNNDDPPMAYVTWDASMDANFKQIELLLNQLYTISEMGSAVFGDLTSKTGEVPSGSALRRLMMSPLAKARRIANSFDPALKGIICACAAVYGETLSPQDISIKWNDGLPNDEVENANIMHIRTGNKPTISQHTAIKRLDNMTDADAAAELEEIRGDETERDMGTEIPQETPEQKPESEAE